MKLTDKNKIIIAVSVQLAILLFIIISKVSVLIWGTDVFLQIEPVDPRDPLRGDYVTFRYKISRIPYKYFEYSDIRNGDTVYIPLEQHDKYWTAVKGVREKKPSERKNLFIKGKVARGGLNEFAKHGFSPSSQISIVYGIEEYFIPEGTGRGFNFTGRDIWACVSVDKNGNAVLKKLYIDNKPWPHKKRK